MLELVSDILVVLGLSVFAWRRSLQYLRFLQQEEYDTGRFLRWLRQYRFYDRKATLTLAIAAAALSFVAHGAAFTLAIVVLAMGALLAIAFRERDPRRQGKITLKMTERAKRIHQTATALTVAVIIFAVWASNALPGAHGVVAMFLFAIAVVQLLPVLLCGAVLLLEPAEQQRKRQFLTEAKEKYRRVAPYTVGITGSYGKTSTKAILGKVLETALGPTFWPVKGINTEMGITREIRERLTDSHQWAVIEMGAYRRGSIARLCELTPPNAAIVTAVGLMHLDRMGSADNVLLAKSELAQAVPADGVLVCNGDNDGAREIAKRHPKQTTLLYGLEPERGGLACWADEITFKLGGTHFRIHWGGRTYPAFSPLHGRPALSNVLGAFAMAASLGGDPEYVIASFRSLQPVNNRLEVVAQPGYVQINDAYNSNPVGFAAALEVLKSLPGERKILVTPGMIELGEEQFAENARIGRLAASCCDLAFVVGSVNREALAAGLKEGGLAEEAIRFFDNRDGALEALAQLRQAGDVVLLENDLPDLYELDIRL
ncbi:MAG: UDP-N-acetylmuramoyl-tripeptide--D-alanyl-D-alanine ligase [Bdellovibrionales bacterium]|nr:UDP-N-acetylmuramoyl-tripeptide--D-alanyl-D-alanine ligase [Bdellovibrionales bacterium]